MRNNDDDDDFIHWIFLLFTKIPPLNDALDLAVKAVGEICSRKRRNTVFLEVTIGRTSVWTLSQALAVKRWCVCVFPFTVNPYRQQLTFQRQAKTSKLTADGLLTGTSVRLLFVILFYSSGVQASICFPWCELWLKYRLVFMLMQDSQTDVFSSVYVSETG